MCLRQSSVIVHGKGPDGYGLEEEKTRLMVLIDRTTDTLSWLLHEIAVPGGRFTQTPLLCSALLLSVAAFLLPLMLLAAKVWPFYFRGASLLFPGTVIPSDLAFA